MGVCHECNGTGRAVEANDHYLSGVPCRSCGGAGQITRRREGARSEVLEVMVTPRVKVTAHPGDRFQPPLVRVWNSDGESDVWACGAELTRDQAVAAAVALVDASEALIQQEGT